MQVLVVPLLTLIGLVLQVQKLTDWEIMGDMMPYLLPANDKSARNTMAAALSLLVASKLLNVQVTSYPFPPTRGLRCLCSACTPHRTCYCAHASVNLQCLV